MQEIHLSIYRSEFIQGGMTVLDLESARISCADSSSVDTDDFSALPKVVSGGLIKN